jgi:hypothetical protein
MRHMERWARQYEHNNSENTDASGDTAASVCCRQRSDTEVCIVSASPGDGSQGSWKTNTTAVTNAGTAIDPACVLLFWGTAPLVCPPITSASDPFVGRRCPISPMRVEILAARVLHQKVSSCTIDTATQHRHDHVATMGVQKKTRKFAQVKRVIGEAASTHCKRLRR